ncbi:ABC transporter substrate-binding protein [Haloarcula nitratireducens]|uniref:Solute-binding protein family 5 domain-containing protein n=1 Tax=Haloarcula nitratireducens TaxID=2487749 RepID=A0AAW4PHA7_9EURY|nr:ABC transporter substrate-binding protein [Halomicroarcula nitratireducens]MBX0297013.1 hypothetical protein [Halomicroarcula nitratireducens]
MNDTFATYSRRSILQSLAIATGGTAAVGMETGVSSAQTRQDITFRVPVAAATDTAQFNPRNEMDRVPAIEAFLYEPLAEYDPEDDEFVPVLADEWDVEDQRLTVTLEDDYEWHSVATASGKTIGGQPVTASDIVRQFQFDEAADAAYWNVISDVSVAREPRRGGGGTVAIDFDGDVNVDVLLFDVLTQHVSHSPTYFENTSPSAAASLSLAADDDGPPVGTGPFKYADQTDEGVVLEPAASHPAADEINWQTYSFESHQSEHAVLDGLAAGRFDGTREAHFPEEYREAAGDSLDNSLQEVTNESSGGWGILLNHEHPHLQNRRFRKAIAHIFSSAEAVESMTASVVESVALQTGLSPAQTRKYLDGELGKFEMYGDEKRAGELLGELGFSRTWEIWNDSRGGSLTLGMIGAPNPTQDTSASQSPSEPAWYYGVRSFERQLNEFFRDQDPDIQDSWFNGTDLAAPVGVVEQFTDVGVHDDIFAFLPARQWGHMAQTHPYHTFRADMLMREASDLGFGPVVSVPPYANPGGPEEEVDIRETLASLQRANEEDEERRLVRELAWIVNETVPYLQGYYRPSVSYLDDEGWSFPDASELDVAYPSTHLPRTGDIQATEQR